MTIHPQLRDERKQQIRYELERQELLAEDYTLLAVIA